MKFLFLTFIFIYNLFGFNQPQNPFIVNFIEQKDNVLISINYPKNISIYKESIKIKDNNTQKNILLPKAKIKDEIEIYNSPIALTIPKNILSQSGKLELTFQGCSDEGFCFMPQTKTFEYKFAKVEKKEIIKSENSFFDDKSFFSIIGSFFVFGLLLSLTPCVFPMIPILSGILVKMSNLNSKKGFFISLVYVLSMSITYTIAGVLAGLFGGNIQALFQTPWIIIGFSMIFIGLALSMFGFYEITLPQKIQDKLSKKSDNASNKGGIIGVAVMGFLSALIVGPCVAPPLAGALVYIAQSGDAFLGGMALFVMSIGMGMPLLLIGLGAGKYLPKAGGWMEKVNTVFGVVMVSLAIWMVSRILDENTVIFIWALWLIAIGIFMDFLEPFEEDKKIQSRFKKLFAFISLLYGAILFIGAVAGATNPLKPFEPFTQKVVQEELNFQRVNNLKELQNIIDSNQKVMIKFSAKWCANCKKFKNTTLKDKEIISLLKNYKLVEIDVTNNTQNDKQILKYFEIVGPPAVIIFENGKQKPNILGYKSPKEFKSLL